MRIGRAPEAIPVHEPMSPEPLQERPPAALEGPSFTAMMSGIGTALDRGEALTSSAIRGASTGAGLSAGELIALQAGIYRYSEVVDLATKLVDRATSAVKTTLQSQ